MKLCSDRERTFMIIISFVIFFSILFLFLYFFFRDISSFFNLWLNLYQSSSNQNDQISHKPIPRFICLFPFDYNYLYHFQICFFLSFSLSFPFHWSKLLSVRIFGRLPMRISVSRDTVDKVLIFKYLKMFQRNVGYSCEYSL